jgi:hypothetical protein
VEDASHLDAEHDPRPGHEHTAEDVRPTGTPDSPDDAAAAHHRRDETPSLSDERLRTPAGPATAQEADGD